MKEFNEYLLGSDFVFKGFVIICLIHLLKLNRWVALPIATFYIIIALYIIFLILFEK